MLTWQIRMKSGVTEQTGLRVQESARTQGRIRRSCDRAMFLASLFPFLSTVYREPTRRIQASRRAAHSGKFGTAS